MESFKKQCKYLEEALNHSTKQSDDEVDAKIIGHTYIQQKIVFLVKTKGEKNVKVLLLDDLKVCFPNITLEYLKSKSNN